MHYLIINSRFGSKLLAARLPRTAYTTVLLPSKIYSDKGNITPKLAYSCNKTIYKNLSYEYQYEYSY